MKNHKYVFLLTPLLVFALIITIVININHKQSNIIINNNSNFLADLGIYTTDIYNISMETNDYTENASGAWHINKSADWIAKNKIQLTIDLDTIVMPTNKPKDVILVYDISGSMENEKIEAVKEDTKSLFTYLFNTSTNDNKVAVITFSDDSEILTDFTDNKPLLNDIMDNLVVGGNTNYNAALQNVDSILSNYNFDSSRDVSVHFLTDGYPNIDSRSQANTFDTIKEKYPYLRIDGVQYEMGESIIKEIEEVSDNQYIAWHNDIHSILREAVLAPYSYNVFTIEDYINTRFFDVSQNDIKASRGEASLSGDKVTWNLNNKIKTGQSAVLTIDLTLKQEYVDQEETFPTNTKTSINASIQGITDNNETTTATPVLSNPHKVIYDTNPPSSCQNIKREYEEEYYVFDTVTKRSEDLSCEGYVFKGYEFREIDIKSINDDMFVMPGHDVHIKGVWTKQAITKSMDGTIAENTTLYTQVKYDAENKFTAFEYDKTVDDTNKILSSSEKKDVYFYQGNVDDNNVLFANYCWKMIRTTVTGGVKIIYNGTPTYNIETNSYTCNNTGDRAQVGEARYNTGTESLAYLGYMYNKVYKMTKKNFYESVPVLESVYMLDAPKYYYGDTFEFVSGKYYLKNSDDSELTTFSSWADEYENIKGKYTCKLDTLENSCNKLYYVSDTTNEKMYNIPLVNGQDYTDVDYTYVLGDSYTDNQDGTFTINNPVNKKRSDWNKEYNDVSEYYACPDYTSTTCDSVHYLSNVSDIQFIHKTITDNFIYSNSFTFDGTYHLSGEKKTFWDFQNNYMDLDNTHYTCFNTSGDCQKIYFIYFTRENEAWYIEIADGKGIEDAKREMLYADDVNATESNIKKYVENWYRDNIDKTIDENNVNVTTKFSDFVEDTIYCNGREIETSYGWTETGNMHGYPTWQSLPITAAFKGWGDYKEDAPPLTCSYNTDKFSVSDEVGNGKLNYPVGLLTSPEAYLARTENGNTNSNFYLKSGNQYMLMNPYYVNTYELSVRTINGRGQINGTFTWYGTGYGVNGVRPVISLIPDIEYSAGDGTTTYPYVIDIGY